MKILAINSSPRAGDSGKAGHIVPHTHTHVHVGGEYSHRHEDKYS